MNDIQEDEVHSASSRDINRVVGNEMWHESAMVMAGFFVNHIVDSFISLVFETLDCGICVLSKVMPYQ